MSAMVKKMDYAETLEYLFTQTPVYQNIGSKAYKPGLDNVRQLDAIYGHPHHNFSSIHVAGTNGKGSTSHLIASCLQSAGYRVGLFTSPHLKDFRERIRVQGVCIPQEAVIRFVDRFRHEAAHRLQPSFFELTTLMAFDWFAQAKVDVAVIEVGLGGRLDSSNILSPILSVITNVSLDHTALLGNTIPAIAFEKAGIIKPHTPVVLGNMLPEALEVMLHQASEKEAPVHRADPTRTPIPCALKGDYQQENTATVRTALDVLQTLGYAIAPSAIHEGFARVIQQTGLRGRWETIGLAPRIICDTGHNEAGIRSIAHQLKNSAYDRLHIVLGVANDKDVPHMLPLLPKEARYYFTKAATPRSMPETTLQGIAAGMGMEGSSYPSVVEALNAAKKNCRPEDLIFVGGSNFVVAEILPDSILV